MTNYKIHTWFAMCNKLVALKKMNSDDVAGPWYEKNHQTSNFNSVQSTLPVNL